MTEPVDVTEIARRLGVEAAAVNRWRAETVMPEPKSHNGGAPVRDWTTVEQWARDNGRL